MKKLLVLATAAFLFTGVAFAHGDDKNCGKDGKDKSCCSKDAKGKKDECKDGKDSKKACCAKDAKTKKADTPAKPTKS
jgi:hypothetical protein